MRSDYELQWSISREIIAAIYNVNRSEKQEALKGSDIIKLSFDGEEEKKEVTEEQAASDFKKLKAAMGSKFKK